MTVIGFAMNLFNIPNEKRFNEALVQIANEQALITYDCGSQVEFKRGKIRYSTIEFKRDLRDVEPKSRLSKVVLIETNKNITFDRKVLWLENTEMNTPLNETPFYQFLLANQDDASEVTGYLNTDVHNFMAHYDYDRTFHKIDPDQYKVLKCVHSHFYYLKHNNRLEDELEVDLKLDQSSTLQELSLCSIDGCVLSLPSVTLNHYNEIKTLLINAGAKYRKNTFIFKTDAAPIVDKLLGGSKVNIKQQFQQFYTPDLLGVMAVKRFKKLNKNSEWFEPSAGSGKLADKLNAVSAHGHCVELDESNVQTLLAKGYSVSHCDFMKYEDAKQYDAILANPPFTKNQDIDHIKKMYEQHLKDGGELVSFASASWLSGGTKKQVEFRSFLESVNAHITEIEAGAFKESGTNIKTCLIYIEK